MTDNKLTDEQIIKALEVHGNEKFDNCEGCPYLEGDSCEGFAKYSKPYRDVLDLINRQKAEIEELERANLQLMAILQTAQSEARKEFAERLKKKAKIEWDTQIWRVKCDEIDNLLKEMEGESE